MSNEPIKRLPEASAFDTPAEQPHVDAKTMLAAFDRIAAAAREHPKPSEGLHAELTGIAEAAVQARSKIDEARRLNEEADALFADILSRTERLLAEMTPAEAPAAEVQPFIAEPQSPEAEERAFLDALGVDHVADEPVVENAAVEEPAVMALSNTVVDADVAARAIEPERVPTVSHVVNQLGRSADIEEQPEATAANSVTNRTTVAMLEAMVEQLAAAMPAEPRPPLDAQQDENAVRSAPPEQELAHDPAELRAGEETHTPVAEQLDHPLAEEAKLQVGGETENQIVEQTSETAESDIVETAAPDVSAEPAADIATGEIAAAELATDDAAALEAAGAEVAAIEVAAEPEIATAAEIEATQPNEIAALATPQPESIEAPEPELRIEPELVAETPVQLAEVATATVLQEAPQEAPQETPQDTPATLSAEVPAEPEPDIAWASEADSPAAAEADFVADNAEPDGPTPDETQSAVAQVETAEPNAAVLELAEADLAETAPAETDVSEIDVAQSEPPVADAEQPASGSVGVRAPAIPEVELLNSFARIEAMAFLPPDIGTAVIFQKPKATEAAVDEPVDLPPIEAVAAPAVHEPADGPEMDVVAIEPRRVELHLPKTPMLEHAAIEPIVIEPVTMKPIEDEPILVMPPPDPSEVEFEQSTATSDQRDESADEDSAFDDSELDSLLFGPSPDARSEPEITSIEAPQRPARTFEAPVFRQIAAAPAVQSQAASVAPAAAVPSTAQPTAIAWGTDVPVPASALARAAQPAPEPEPAIAPPASVTAPASIPAPASPVQPQRAVPASVAYDALAPLRAMSDEERVALFE